MLRQSLTAAALSLAALTTPALAADTYELDESHADVVFNISHLGYSDTWGRFNTVTGTIVMDQADIATSTVEITIDAASIDTNHAKRDEHLRGPDFFNTSEFPEITFVSTGVEETGENTGRVTGDLTLLGTTRPVTLDVTLNKVAPHPIPSYDGVVTAGFSARGTIQRSDFGMTTFLPAIEDEIDLFIDIEAFKQ